VLRGVRGETVYLYDMISVLMTVLAMTLHVSTPVVQHFAEEGGAATQQPTVEVLTIRQNAHVLQVPKESQEQEELAEGLSAKD